jgi:hypothetical protein
MDRLLLRVGPPPPRWSSPNKNSYLAAAVNAKCWLTEKELKNARHSEVDAELRYFLESPEMQSTMDKALRVKQLPQTIARFNSACDNECEMTRQGERFAAFVKRAYYDPARAIGELLGGEISIASLSDHEWTPYTRLQWIRPNTFWSNRVASPVLLAFYKREQNHVQCRTQLLLLTKLPIEGVVDIVHRYLFESSDYL